MNTSVSQQINAAINELPPTEQLRVLAYARSLVHLPHGTSGKMLASATCGISPEDLDLMQKAIEEGCERIESSDW